MPITARQRRGRATQQIVAAYLRLNGWPWATAKTGAANGRDVDNLPGIALEVKATADNPGAAALRQAAAYAREDLPIAIWRPNGYGAERIEDWVGMVRVGDLIGLLRDAGYGDPRTPPIPNHTDEPLPFEDPA